MMPLPAIILLTLITIAVITKVSIVDVYYRKLKGDKDAKGRVAFESVFGRRVSFNIQSYILVKELPPFPESYSVYMKYQQRVKRLNRFISFCFFLLMLYVGYKIVIMEIHGE
ncbi:hypothetical protein PDL71_11860 [Lacibacter sp. MH-610]|uniref:hypothetical protein n=1 Tax=Lacibacter sp. MH-610 TaxID=3020883 RepID=UPI003891C1EA